jgi:hypothetical protein
MRVSGWLGGVTEWLMVADCKSAGLTPYVGSNPTPTIRAERADKTVRAERWNRVQVGADLSVLSVFSALSDRLAGVAQLVEHQPSKLRVAGSSPVARLSLA